MRPEERVELAALRDLFAAAPAGLGAHAAEVGGATCFTLPRLADSKELNRAFGLGLDEPATEEGVDEIVAHFRRVGSPCWIQVAPRARPPELVGWLLARGLAEGYAWQNFVRRAEPVADPPSPLRVAACGQDEAERFGRVFSAGYGLPPVIGEWVAALPGRTGWHCLGAWDGGELVGTGALFVDGDAGWLGLAATLAEHRGRGAQGALLAARIRRAADAGCDVVATETGVPKEGRPGASYRNISRAGFQPAYVRRNYSLTGKIP